MMILYGIRKRIRTCIRYGTVHTWKVGPPYYLGSPLEKYGDENIAQKKNTYSSVLCGSREVSGARGALMTFPCVPFATARLPFAGFDICMKFRVVELCSF
jgi:hypothetical protein